MDLDLELDNFLLGESVRDISAIPDKIVEIIERIKTTNPGGRMNQHQLDAAERNIAIIIMPYTDDSHYGAMIDVYIRTDLIPE